MVRAVYTQPPRSANRGKKETLTPIHRLALQNNIAVHTPASRKAPAEQEKLRAIGADLAIVIAYGLILPQAVLDAFPLGCINLHASKLPRWRGAAPIQRAIMAGDRMTAMTTMQMDAGLDTGAVLLEKEMPIFPGMTAGELHDALAALAGPLLLATLDALAAGTLTPRPQPEEGATYAHKIRKEESRIDWQRPGEDLVRHIHGLSPYPGAYAILRGERIRILRAAFLPSETGLPAGCIADEALGITCGDGMIRPLEVQRQGKSPMKTEDFLRGFTVNTGERLEYSIPESE